MSTIRMVMDPTSSATSGCMQQFDTNGLLQVRVYTGSRKSESARMPLQRWRLLTILHITATPARSPKAAATTWLWSRAPDWALTASKPT
ncbi:MAG: hypothetical protein JWR34_4812 [Mycobacterium sp.]|nr:hypothetical protein [Mycobacterium sp.]